MTPTEIVQQFKQLNRSSPHFPDQLTSLLYGKEYKECIPKLQDQEVVWLVEYLDAVLDTPRVNSSSAAFRKCLRELMRICGAREKLPNSYKLESSLLIPGKYPVASGGSGDIYEGSLNGSKVCVKRLRIYAGEESPVARKTFYREAVMWKRLTHPNIVPLLGITLNPLQLISAWMPGGELREYVTHHPSTDRLRLVFDVANGLKYLHSCNIIHGDLKGPNILVDDAGSPRITDFGLAMVAQNQDSIRSTQGDRGHTARWTAPEILNEKGTHSKEADVFSFAMIMVEVFTGQVPFHSNPPPAAVLAILAEKRPTRPNNPQVTAELWMLMKTCWDHDPHRRPEMSTVMKTLRDSNPSLPNDCSSDVSISCTLVESTESETVESPESFTLPLPPPSEEKSLGTDKPHPDDLDEVTGADEGSSEQGPENPRALTQNTTSSESDPHGSEGQAGKPSPLTGLRPLRRGTDQSVHTPLPVDPPQITFDEFHDPVDGYLRTNPQSNPPNDTVGDPAMTRQSGLQEGNLGASHSVLTLPDQHRTGNDHSSGSRNPSDTHLVVVGSENHPGNPSRPQLDLPDLGKTRSQLSLGTLGNKTLPRHPSRTPLGDTNSSANASRHELGAGTKSRNQSQMSLLPGATPTLKGSSHSGPGDGRLHDPSDCAELPKLELDDTSPTSEASRGARNQYARTDLGEDTSGKEGSRRTSGVTASGSKKGPGIWYRIKRLLGCVSDKNAAA